MTPFHTPAFHRPSPFDIPETLEECVHQTIGGRWIAAHRQGNLWKTRDTDDDSTAVGTSLESLADRPCTFTYRGEYAAYEAAERIYRNG